MGPQEHKVERRLAAIFAADVAGYSRLMSLDEVGTLRTLTAHRQIMDRLIADHRGRIANTAGDSVLAEFPSAVDAVQCAVDVQHALSQANQDLPEEPTLRFRIGVHVGDVVVRNGDLLGFTCPSHHKAVLDRILGDFRTVPDAELLEHTSAIGADRFELSDRSSPISVTVLPEAIRDMTSYSRSESVSCGVRVRSLLTPSASFSASAGLTYRPPARTLRTAFANSSGALSLVMYASGAGLQDTDGELIFLVTTQDQHRQPGPFSLEFLEEIQAALPGRVMSSSAISHVFLRSCVHGLPRIGGFSKRRTVELIGQQRPQTTADHRVVIDDEDSDGRGSRILEAGGPDRPLAGLFGGDDLRGSPADTLARSFARALRIASTASRAADASKAPRSPAPATRLSRSEARALTVGNPIVPARPLNRWVTCVSAATGPCGSNAATSSTRMRMASHWATNVATKRCRISSRPCWKVSC